MEALTSQLEMVQWATAVAWKYKRNMKMRHMGFEFRYSAKVESAENFFMPGGDGGEPVAWCTYGNRAIGSRRFTPWPM